MKKILVITLSVLTLSACKKEEHGADLSLSQAEQEAINAELVGQWHSLKEHITLSSDFKFSWFRLDDEGNIESYKYKNRPYTIAVSPNDKGDPNSTKIYCLRFEDKTFYDFFTDPRNDAICIRTNTTFEPGLYDYFEIYRRVTP